MRQTVKIDVFGLCHHQQREMDCSSGDVWLLMFRCSVRCGVLPLLFLMSDNRAGTLIHRRGCPCVTPVLVESACMPCARYICGCVRCVGRSVNICIFACFSTQHAPNFCFLHLHVVFKPNADQKCLYGVSDLSTATTWIGMRYLALCAQNPKEAINRFGFPSSREKLEQWAKQNFS